MILERPVRIELTSLAWKANVQPLYHTRKLFGTQGEIRTLTFGFGIQRATKPYYLFRY